MAKLFDYLDYRKFLADAFAERKKAEPHFSHRYFAGKAGFSSPNFVQLVMQGKRSLSQESILKIVKALKLNKEEAEFFENLVRFNQSKTDEERNFYYQRLASSKRYQLGKIIEQSHYEYYSKWYYSVIREMVLLRHFKEDSEWISAQLNPPISPREAQSSLELLEKLGFIARDKQGKLMQEERYIDTGDEVISLAVANYHREMIGKGLEAIEKTPPEQREISAVTFAVSEERWAKAKKMIQDFRKRLSHFLAEEEHGTIVYQFNMQLFNVTASKEKKP